MAVHQEHKAKKARQVTQSPPQRQPPIQEPTTQLELSAPQTLRRAVAQPGRLTPGGVQMLQRSFGNRAVVGLLPRTSPRLPIQAKLTVNPVGDPYEREADRVAEQVVGTLDGAQHGIQRLEEDKEVQTQALPGTIQRLSSGGGGSVSPEMEDEIRQARGGGSSLPGDVREPMEQAFGADFQGVRVHTDANADTLSQSLQARAFTTGQDIFFKSGEYNPASSSGKQLLAHELTHTRQQGATNRVARWGGPNNTKHSQVTKKALEELDQKWKSVYNKPGVARYLELFSHRMDAREVIKWDIAKRPRLKKSMQKNAQAWVTKAGESRDTDEDVNHAETGHYRETGGEAATRKRIKDWRKRAQDEAKGGNANEAFMFLGLALHTAEDIGAHGFGEPGKGHDPHLWVKPPKLKKGEEPPSEFAKWKKGWKFTYCDKESKNKQGFDIAVQEAKALLTAFAKYVKLRGWWWWLRLIGRKKLDLQPRYKYKKKKKTETLQDPRYQWTKFGSGDPTKEMVEGQEEDEPWSPKWGSKAHIADQYA
jgi:hypothetical protein